MPDVPAPRSRSTSAPRCGGGSARREEWLREWSALDLRHAGRLAAGRAARRRPDARPGPLLGPGRRAGCPTTLLVHQAALTYISDLTLLGVTLVAARRAARRPRRAGGLARPHRLVPPAVPRRRVAALRPVVAVAPPAPEGSRSAGSSPRTGAGRVGGAGGPDPTAPPSTWRRSEADRHAGRCYGCGVWGRCDGVASPPSTTPGVLVRLRLRVFAHRLSARARPRRVPSSPGCWASPPRPPWPPPPWPRRPRTTRCRSRAARSGPGRAARRTRRARGPSTGTAPMTSASASSPPRPARSAGSRTSAAAATGSTSSSTTAPGEHLYAHLADAYVTVGQRSTRASCSGRVGESGGRHRAPPALRAADRGVDQHAWFTARRFAMRLDPRSRNCPDTPVAGDWDGDGRRRGRGLPARRQGPVPPPGRRPAP